MTGEPCNCDDLAACRRELAMAEARLKAVAELIVMLPGDDDDASCEDALDATDCLDQIVEVLAPGWLP